MVTSAASSAFPRQSFEVTAGTTAAHRHGLRVHSHPSDRPHRHLWRGLRLSRPVAEAGHHAHEHGDEHGHSHGLVDRSVLRSREGIKAVALSLVILGIKERIMRVRQHTEDFTPSVFEHVTAVD
jgi:hypothetical protein